MKRFALLIIAWNSFSITQDNTPCNTLCISLGWNCQVAANLRDNNLRSYSFPFDWNQTSYEGLCALIRNHFQDLLNPTYLIYKAPNAAGVFNTKYNVALSHAFPTYIRDDGIRTVIEQYLDFLPGVTATYQRRIERFYDACKMADHVYFIRLGSERWRYDTYIGKHNVTELRDILQIAFPHGNWHLVVVHNNPEYQEDWHIPKVVNIHMPTIVGDTHAEWQHVLTILGLIQSPE